MLLNKEMKTTLVVLATFFVLVFIFLFGTHFYQMPAHIVGLKANCITIADDETNNVWEYGVSEKMHGAVEGQPVNTLVYDNGTPHNIEDDIIILMAS